MRKQSRAIRRALVAACAGLLLASCGQPGTEGPISASDSASSEAPEATATQQQARVTNSVVPDGDGLFKNASTVYSMCSGEFGDDPAATGEVFDTTTGRNEPISIPQLPAGEEFSHAACTVTRVGEQNRAIFVIVSKTPSKGLQAETLHTRIVATTPGSDVPVATVDWPAEIAAPHLTTANGASVRSIQPTENGFVAVGGMYSETLAGVFDAATLQLRAHVPTSVATGSSQSVDVSFDGVAVSYTNGDADRLDDRFDAHFYSAADGAEVGVFPNRGAVVPLEHGFLLTHSNEANEDGSAPPPGVFYFDMRTAELVGPIAPWLDEGGLKAPLTAPDRQQWADTVLLRGYSVTGGAYMEVYDLAARRSVFHLDDRQMGELAVGDTALGGNFLYMSKDPDNPVIDVHTTDTVSDGWTLRALNPLPNGWVLLQPDEPDTAPQTEGRYLARGETGDYDGPWF